RTRSLPSAVAIDAGLTLRPFTVAGYLAGLDKTVEIERWPKRVPARPVLLQEGLEELDKSGPGKPPQPLTPRAAARLTRHQMGLGSDPGAAAQPFLGTIEDVAYPTIPDAAVVAVLLADVEGQLHIAAQD